MKKISVLIPCYNEQENVEAISKAVLETLTRDLPQYDYELVFIDNDSTDDTRPDPAQTLRGEPEDQGHLQCPQFRTVQLSVLRYAAGDRRLRH